MSEARAAKKAVTKRDRKSPYPPHRQVKRVDVFLEQLLRCPTTPYHEGYVLREIRRISAAANLGVESDASGNLLVTPARLRRRRGMIVFVAHTDHPGFVIESHRGRSAIAQWHGGVLPKFFPNARVRLVPYDPKLSVDEARGRAVRARVRSTTLDRERRRVESVRLALDEPLGDAPAWIGFWDVPDFRLRGERIVSARIDDVAGCALALAALCWASEGTALPAAGVLITRAEEVGFHGALVAATSRLVPKESLFVSIEMSSKKAGVKMGAGPVVRMGDAAGVFEPRSVRWVQEAATHLGERKGLAWQKRLMDGGTCEGTVFAAAGEAAAGVAVPLAGYHNMSDTGVSIVPEQIDQRDVYGALALLAELARAWPGKLPLETKLAGVLEKRRREGRAKLAAAPLPRGFTRP